MPESPAFVKSPANRIAAASQFTDDIEGYVFDGADGSQVALWTASADRVSQEHAHDFDEYILVIEGRCTVIIGGDMIELGAGQEFVIPKGTRQSVQVAAGTADKKRKRRAGARNQRIASLRRSFSHSFRGWQNRVPSNAKTRTRSRRPFPREDLRRGPREVGQFLMAKVGQFLVAIDTFCVARRC